MNGTEDRAFLHLDKQLDKVANTSAAMATTVNGLSDANSVLGSTCYGDDSKFTAAEFFSGVVPNWT